MKNDNSKNNENIKITVNRINEVFRNRLILIGVIGLFGFLILFSIIWLAIPLILILIYAAYRSDIIKNKQLNTDSKTLSAIGDGLKKIAKTDTKNLFEVNGYYQVGTWFIHNGSLGFDFFSANEIVWVYLKSTKHSVNFVPTGTSYGVVIHLKSGKMLETDYGYGDINQQRTAQKLLYLQRVTPNALYGYNKDLKSLINKDRAGFVKLANTAPQVATTPQLTYSYGTPPERISQEKITREDGYLYYVGKDGHVWRLPTKQNPNGKKEKIGKERIKRVAGYLYFIDKDGYVARQKSDLNATSEPK